MTSRKDFFDAKGPFFGLSTSIIYLNRFGLQTEWMVLFLQNIAIVTSQELRTGDSNHIAPGGLPDSLWRKSKLRTTSLRAEAPLIAGAARHDFKPRPFKNQTSTPGA